MNPYPGLRPFREDEACFFFGRDGQTDEILERLAEWRFVAMLGVSGCGKSSLIHAGLFPGLHGGLLPTGRRGWKIAHMQPRGQPVGNLVRALVKADALVDTWVGPEDSAGEAGRKEAVEIISGMLGAHGSARTLADLLKARLRSDGEDNSSALLLVVDQFEEIFRFARSGSAEEASHFVQLLLTLNTIAMEEDLPLYLILAMRSDFIGECAAFPGLPERINRSQYLVPRLSLSGREAVIVRPAATQGRTLGRALVDRLLDDIGEDPDQLPVLQHALMRTWAAWEKEKPRTEEIDLRHYHHRSVGGMKRAIRVHAEEAFKSLTPSQRILAEALFRCVTERGDYRRPVRRPLPLGTLAEIAGTTPEMMMEVVDRFRTHGRTFLSPPEGTALGPDSVIDISHESLIHKWPRLTEWVRKESEAVAELRRQSKSAADFRSGKQDRLSWIELQRVERWRGNKVKGDVPVAIIPSVKWVGLNLGPEDDPAAILHEVDAFFLSSQDQLMEEKWKRWRHKMLLRGAGWMISLLILGFGIHFFLQKDVLAKEVEKRQSLVEVIATTMRQLSLPLVEAAQVTFSSLEQQEAALFKILELARDGDLPSASTLVANTRELREKSWKSVKDMESLHHSMQKVYSTTKEEDLSLVAELLKKNVSDFRGRLETRMYAQQALEAATLGMTVRLDRAMAAMEPRGGPAPRELSELKVALETAIKELADLDALKQCAMELGAEERGFADLDARRELAMQRLAGISELLNERASPAVRRVRTLDVTDSANAVKLVHSAGTVTRMRFVPNASPPVIASVTDNPKMALNFWNSSGTLMYSAGSSSGMTDVSFNRMGTVFATASTGSSVRVYNSIIFHGVLRAQSKQGAVKAFTHHADTITDVEFNDAGLVVSASVDRTVRVFDAGTMLQQYFTSPPLPKIVTAAVFHPSAMLVASACDDNIVRLHTIKPPGVKPVLHFKAPARRPDFSADGSLLVSCSGDGTARIASVERGRELSVLDHGAAVELASFQPSQTGALRKGHALVTVAADGVVRFARSTDGTEWPRTPQALDPQHPGPALSITWVPDGARFATVGGGEVLVWEMGENLPLPYLRVIGLPWATSRIDFSPDGRALLAYGADSTAFLIRIPDSTE